MKANRRTCLPGQKTILGASAGLLARDDVAAALFFALTCSSIGSEFTWAEEAEHLMSDLWARWWPGIKFVCSQRHGGLSCKARSPLILRVCERISLHLTVLSCGGFEAPQAGPEAARQWLMILHECMLADFLLIKVHM